MMEDAEERRETMLDAISMFSDELTEAMLDEKVTEELIIEATRNGVISLELCPVFCGSAYKNKGVQPLMDAVLAFLPSPTDIPNYAIDPENEEERHLVTNDDSDPFLSYAFKLEDGAYGQLTYVRIYQGKLIKGDFIHNARTEKKVKVGRIVRMHSDNMDDIDEAGSGDIVALFGIDCASGDTFRSDNTNLVLDSMHVPEPVIHLAIKPIDRKASDNMSKALQRFTKEDPTFRVRFDAVSSETIVSGMGELHLEVYIERMKREFKAEVEVGAPQVAFRERITQVTEYDYTHKKQTGGSGQFGRIIGTVGPNEKGVFEFESKVTGGNVPREYIPSVEKGFAASIVKGQLIGAPVDGLSVILRDGNYHQVDSSDMAFQAAAKGCFREYYMKAKPEVLEPLMKVELEGPSEFQGDMIGTLNQRRGILTDTFDDDGFVRIEADVPLAEMFGYSTILRSATQGKAEFTMEFARYSPAPRDVQEELIAKYKQELEDKK
jgi:elongation factor G